MRHFVFFLLIAYALLALSGCANNYSFPQAVYEGSQIRNQLQTPPTERAGKPEPLSYQQYDAERKRP